MLWWKVKLSKYQSLQCDMPPDCNALYTLLSQVERLYYSNHLLRSRTCTTLTSDKTNFRALENTSLSLEVLPWEPIIHYWVKSVSSFAWLIYICSINFSYCLPQLVQTRGSLTLRLRGRKRKIEDMMDGPWGTEGSKTNDNLQQSFLGHYSAHCKCYKKQWLTPHEVWEV